MEDYKENIDRQFSFNHGKNLFYRSFHDLLKFSPETLDFIQNADLSDPDRETLMIDYLTSRALQEFCRMNQYYAFGSEARSALKEVYTELCEAIKEKRSEVETIAEEHYNKLRNWLRGSNAFAESIYSPDVSEPAPVLCSEYSATLQLEILQLDPDHITEPVLDIGCGMQGRLVRYLREKGIESYGIDRFVQSHPHLTESDWLEYTYVQDHWGTIVSNLGFSNHFIHHHLRNNGHFADYARKYMEILHSLKTGGVFCYAPDLPFIELFLEPADFNLQSYSTGQYGIRSSKVTRNRQCWPM